MPGDGYLGVRNKQSTNSMAIFPYNLYIRKLRLFGRPGSSSRPVYCTKDCSTSINLDISIVKDYPEQFSKKDQHISGSVCDFFDFERGFRSTGADRGLSTKGSAISGA